MIIFHALYFLKSSGAEWKAMLAHTLPELVYQSNLADHGVWIKLITRPDGRVYYAFVFIYVDCILHINNYNNDFMNNIR